MVSTSTSRGEDEEESGGAEIKLRDGSRDSKTSTLMERHYDGYVKGGGDRDGERDTPLPPPDPDPDYPQTICKNVRT